MQDLTSKAYNRKLQNFQNVHETTRSFQGELLVKKHYCQLYYLERFQPQRFATWAACLWTDVALF